MIKTFQAKITSALVFTLTYSYLLVGIAQPITATPATSATRSIDGTQLVVVRHDPTSSNLRVPPPPAFSVSHSQSATISVNFLPGGATDVIGEPCYDWPAEAKEALNYAASIWASLVDSPVPIVVEACWADFPGSVLGYGGTSDYFVDSGTLYPAALANRLAGTDLNGAAVEMIATYNRNFNWNWGTDGNTPPSKVDFASVALHEICHGIGFAGSMGVEGDKGFWGFNFYPEPAIYDRFTENGAGQTLLSFGNGTVALAAQLTSNDVYFDGSNANAANGGSRPKLYAPGSWKEGSSYSHLDEIFNGTPNALMTYSLSSGESMHSPGPVTMGILQDVGWGTALYEPDLSISLALEDAPDITPGDPVTLTLSIANVGTGSATGVVIRDILPTDILTPTWSASPSLGDITRRTDRTFVWDVEELAAEASGTITVRGTISPLLPLDVAILNVASISADEPESNTNNNSAAIMMGGKRIYLPVVTDTRQ